MHPLFWPTVLLTISNIFMTCAWYGHLKWFAGWGLAATVLVSWGIALAEYCFQVPANRMGHLGGVPTAELKTIQEIITLVVFCVFSVSVLGEKLRWNYLVGFVLIIAAAFFVFGFKEPPASAAPPPPVRQAQAAMR